MAPRNEIANASFLIMNSLLKKEAEAKSGYRFWISHFLKIEIALILWLILEQKTMDLNFFRTSSEGSEILISLVGQQIAKEEECCRQSISVQERMAQCTFEKATALTADANRPKRKSA